MANIGMSMQAVPLWEGTPPGYNPGYGQPVPTLTPYLVQTRQPAGLVVVLPGGGYELKAPHEAEPIARWLNRVGFSAAVVDYRVRPYRHPYPLMDAQRAIQLVRSRAVRWGVDAEHIAILGFSAGGHLASTAGTHLETLAEMPQDQISRFSSRPDAMILCYPVISFSAFRHTGTMENLLGLNPPEELVRSLSNETQVTRQTPPAFLWHTANDEAVPVENSLIFASALSASSVPFELHVFPDGAHGLGLAGDHPSVGQWTGLCERWLVSQGFRSPYRPKTQE